MSSIHLRIQKLSIKSGSSFEHSTEAKESRSESDSSLELQIAMTTNSTVGGSHYLNNDNAAISEVGIAAARDYANWGGEFVDDAIRIGEQPFREHMSSAVILVRPCSCNTDLK